MYVIRVYAFYISNVTFKCNATIRLHSSKQPNWRYSSITLSPLSLSDWSICSGTSAASAML